MLIKNARKLLKKYDLFFGSDYMVVILDKNENYTYLGIRDWCQKVHNEFELDEFIKERGKRYVWFAKKDWYLGHILGNLCSGEEFRIKI